MTTNSDPKGTPDPAEAQGEGGAPAEAAGAESPAAPREAAPEAAPQAAEAGASSGEAEGAGRADEPQTRDTEPGNEQGVQHAGGEQAGDEQPGDEQPGGEQPGDEQPGSERPGEEQPGDDIGNRVRAGGPPDDIGNRAPGAAGPGKKKRRRRKKKGPGEGQPGAEASAEGEGEAGEEAEGEEGEAGEGGERRERRRGPPAAARERAAFSIGEEVFGRVERVTEHAVWIDIAGKATGLFARSELSEGEPPVEGDQFIATVASTGVRGGMLVLSRAPIDLDESKKLVEEAHKAGVVVEGFVTGVVKGGLEVDVAGLRAFAPASHVDLRHGADLSPFVGQRLDFYVESYAKKGRDIVVSRKRMLSEETRKQRIESLGKIEPGSIHKGIVRKVVQWGVFVALPEADNVEGLVHMTEASHDRGARLGELFKVGDEIEVKVLRIDEKGKLWLSRKAAAGDPWDAVKEKYAPGTRHKGKVARLQPFGAFVELETGIDGLIHTADLSWRQIAHPNEVVKEGDEIDVVVASCDASHRRIGLHPAPPESEEEEPRQKVAQGKIVRAIVMQVVEGGLVMRVLGATGRHARAFIPAGQTGTQRGTDLRKEFPVGTKLEAKVLDVDPRRGEAKLSIRALKDDAEKQAYSQYRSAVAKEAKFGTFADLMKKNG